jgi:hypothetical protein
VGAILQEKLDRVAKECEIVLAELLDEIEKD